MGNNHTFEAPRTWIKMLSEVQSRRTAAQDQFFPFVINPAIKQFESIEVENKSMVTNPTNLASISAFGPARATIEGAPLNPEELGNTDAYWRACCYLILGMLYLRENPLLREPLKVEHIKHRLLGHWGSSSGQSFVWVHLNRVIKKYDLNNDLFIRSRPWCTRCAQFSGLAFSPPSFEGITIAAETFQEVLKAVGIQARPGGPKPRLNDLRNRFAIKALEASPDTRDRITRHMLALSTYMGHARLESTYWDVLACNSGHRLPRFSAKEEPWTVMTCLAIPLRSPVVF